MKFLRCLSATLFLCMLSPLSAFASTWAMAYDIMGRVDKNSIFTQATSDGGAIVLSSYSDDYDNNYTSVLKIDRQGNVVWHKSYIVNGIDAFKIESIRETSDQAFILAGQFYDNTCPDDYDYFCPYFEQTGILKLDKNGNVIWSNSYGGASYDTRPNDIQETSDGGFIVAGDTDWPAYQKSFDWTCWILRLDKNGNVIWQKKYVPQTIHNAFPRSIQETSDGGFIVAGVIVDYDDPKNWILRLDQNGNVIWQNIDDGKNKANVVKETLDNGFIVAGSTNRFTKKPNGLILKLDHNGTTVWQSTYGFGFGISGAKDVQQTSDGMFIVVGSLGNDAVILKLNQNGALVWQKVYGKYLNMKWHMGAKTVDEALDGGYIVGGVLTDVTSGISDNLILKLDGNGNIDQCHLSKDINIGYDKITFQQPSNNDAIDVVDTQVTIEAFPVESENMNAVPKPQCSGTPVNSETNCKDGIDNNNDGFTDCEDRDCYEFHHYCTAAPYLSVNFDQYNNAFMYEDDIFNETNQAPYASGYLGNASGNNQSGGINLTLGGRDGKDILNGISGGWIGSFRLYEATDVIISIDYRMTTTMFDTDECAQVLVRVDDGPTEVLDEACGRGVDTGWQTSKILKSLDDGGHSLAIGGFVNKKTGPREIANFYFDNIDIKDAVTAAPPPSSCIIDLQNNSHNCQNISAIDFILEPEDNKVVMRINLDPDQSIFTEALFDVQYKNESSGWTVNIGDSKSNNGFKGDGADQSNDAEMQIKDGVLSVYGSDLTPEANNPLLNLSGVMSASSHIQLKVKNQFLGWSFQGLTGEHRSAFLYALDGQPDTEGPVNYDIYAAFNRTIGTEGRNGYGVERVSVQLK